MGLQQIQIMNSSTFDALMADADLKIMETFGVPLEIILSPGASAITIQVDIETNLSLQILGDRDRISNTQRTASLTLATLHRKDVPEDIANARLVRDNQPYVLVEPRVDGDMVEFILLPEKSAGTSGDRHSTFLY